MRQRTSICVRIWLPLNHTKCDLLQAALTASFTTSQPATNSARRSCRTEWERIADIPLSSGVSAVLVEGPQVFDRCSNCCYNPSTSGGAKSFSHSLGRDQNPITNPLWPRRTLTPPFLGASCDTSKAIAQQTESRDEAMEVDRNSGRDNSDLFQCLLSMVARVLFKPWFNGLATKTGGLK